jgi:hypothetical protein
MSDFRRLGIEFTVSFSTNLGHFGRSPDPPVTDRVAFGGAVRRAVTEPRPRASSRLNPGTLDRSSQRMIEATHGDLDLS